MSSLRTKVAATVAIAAMAAGGCGSAPDEIDEPGGREHGSAAWERLPDPPLSPRTHAVVVGVGDRMVVVGGWSFLCPPNADCETPDAPLFDDGAVFDPATDTWSSIAQPPFGMRRAEYATAALAGSAYVLTGCVDGPSCDARLRLLSYDLAEDAWTDHGPLPGPRAYRHLVAVGRTLVAYASTDEYGEIADLVFDPKRSAWSPVPDDPLPSTYDRFVVPAGNQMVLAGSSRAALDDGEEVGKLAARFDPNSDTWTELPDAPGPGYQLLPTDDGPLLNGHFGDAPGWLLDPETWTWVGLPEQTGEQHDLAGVLDADRASYADPSSVGQLTSTRRLFVYDSAARAYVQIPALPGRADVHDVSSDALGRDLFIHGGQRWAGDGLDGDGAPVGDAWVWTAPKDGA